MANQADNISTIFTWTIEKFSTLGRCHHSDVFLAGGVKWRLGIYPKGDKKDELPVDLIVADSANLPQGWSTYAQLYMSVVDQVSNRYTIHKEAGHIFDARNTERGFWFMPLTTLHDPSRGFLVNDTFIVKAGVSAGKEVEYSSYNSKKETGYVGLKNQGATSYMNSLLQTLYHIPYFRKAIYRMPTTENNMPSENITLALQGLFYKLQYSNYSVRTKDLTKSFEWDESFMQHDVQELNRILCEKLEDKMKGTVLEGTIQEIFEGHHMSYLECINVNYTSQRKESFYDIQLDVKGCQNVYDSLDKYVSVERLEGDNKYHSEEHGFQDAKKGVLFIDFPPVLQLQLKRFDYDFMRGRMVKINDRYEFPLELDLDKGNGKYLSPYTNWKDRNLYALHSVLVHSGGEHGGRYHVLIRPTLSDQWLKFDDERVTIEDVDRALEEQYGGEEELPETNPGSNGTMLKLIKFSNAYMLVYIRKSDMEKIICNADENDLAEPFRAKLKKEQKQKDQKKNKNSNLYIIIKVAQNEDIVEQIGRNIYFDIVNHDKVHNFRVHKWLSFSTFKEEVAKEFGIPTRFQRFWLWAKRINNTYRLKRPLAFDEESQSVGQLSELADKAHRTELKLFLEVELGPDMRPIEPPEKTKDDIMIFFKLYDPVKEELRYVGRLLVKSTSCPLIILTKLNKMAGFLTSQEIELYEEIQFEPIVRCEPIDKKLTFRDSQLEDGNIICFQKACLVGRGQQYRYPDVPSFLEYWHNRQVVRFRSLEKPKEDEFCLELSKLSIYDEVVEKVAGQLGIYDQTRIRLTPHHHHSQKPYPAPLEHRGANLLREMLVDCDQTSQILYYEILKPMPGPTTSAAQPSAPSLCVICLDAPLEGACIPCGHMVGCMSCLEDIKCKNWGCPVCRASVDQVVRIYSA